MASLTSPPPNDFELRYVAPPFNGSASAYAAYLLEHVRLNRPILGHPSLFAPHGFHVRNVGRTSLIALSLLEQARRQPGNWVPYRDHYHGTSANACLIVRDTLGAVLKALPWYQGLQVQLAERALRLSCYYLPPGWQPEPLAVRPLSAPDEAELLDRLGQLHPHTTPLWPA